MATEKDHTVCHRVHTESLDDISNTVLGHNQRALDQLSTLKDLLSTVKSHVECAEKNIKEAEDKSIKYERRFKATVNSAKHNPHELEADAKDAERVVLSMDGPFDILAYLGKQLKDIGDDFNTTAWHGQGHRDSMETEARKLLKTKSVVFG